MEAGGFILWQIIDCIIYRIIVLQLEAEVSVTSPLSVQIIRVLDRVIVLNMGEGRSIYTGKWEGT